MLTGGGAPSDSGGILLLSAASGRRWYPARPARAPPREDTITADTRLRSASGRRTAAPHPASRIGPGWLQQILGRWPERKRIRHASQDTPGAGRRKRGPH